MPAQDPSEPRIQRLQRDELAPSEQVESGEKEFFNSLRPRLISEYIGQDQLINNLQIAIEAAKRRGEPLDHLLFDGPPGLGKTTLGYIIAQEMGVEMTLTSGPTLDKAGTLVGFLTRLKRGDILFIDEIHRCPRVVEEFLYPAMEDFRLDIPIDKGPHARSVCFNLQHFTLIGATTRKGLLTPPLRERFGLQYHLNFYEIPELERIIFRSAGILNVAIEQDGAFEIARRSRGTPRIANRLLRRVRDYATVRANGRITRQVADEALLSLGVDALGLDDLDRNMLKMIVDHYGGGPVGLNAMAATLQEEQDTLTDVVEPYLLKIGFLIRTPRGRMATEAACVHLGMRAPSGLTAKINAQSEMFEENV